MKSSLIAFVLTFISIGLFGQVIPFQGKLTENGVPVNGTKDIVVSITALSWTETHTGVQITDGLYSITLGSITALPGDIFTGVTERQLDITVSGVALSPISLKAPLEKRAFLFGQSDSPILDQNSQPVAYHYVIDYDNGSPGPNFRGLQMDIFGPGRKFGMRSNIFTEATDPDNKIAFLGSATGDGSGDHTAVFGQAFGKGLFNLGLSGNAGGEGNGVGSGGFDPNGSYNTGVKGNAFNNLHGNTGVFGHANGATGYDNIGVVGWSEVTSGEENKGVLGWAKGPGVNKGIVGIATDGTENWAGWFDGNVQTNGRLYAMDYNGADNENITMKAESSGPGDGATGWGTGSYNIGFRGDAANNVWGNVGLTGYATGTVGTDNAGGTFFSQVDDGTTTIGNKGIYSSASGPGVNYGVYGDANGGVENWAGWFQGDVKITGNLSLDGSNSFDSNSGVGQDAYDDQVTQSLNVGGDGDGRHFGLLINASSTNGRQNKGIRADASGPGNTGPTGSTVNAGGEFFAQDNIQNNIGVQGVAWGTTGENNYGGLFYGTTTDPAGTNYGIFSEASGAGTNWAGWFEGDVRLTSSLILDDAGYSRLEKRPEGGFLQLAGDNGSVTGAILSGFWAGNPLPQFLMEDENSGPGVYFAMENDVTNFGRFMLNNIDGGAQTTIDLNGKNGDITALGEVNGSIFRANDFSLGNGKAHIFSGNNGNGDFGLLDLESPSGADNRISMGFTDVSEESGFISIWKNNGGGTDEYALLNVASGGPGGALFGSLFLKDDLGNSVGVNGFGDISATGEINGNTLVSSDGSVQTSDRRYKMNIKHLENSLENTLKLRGVSYNWIDPKKSESNQIGVIAQEVEEVYPEFVKTLKDGYKAVNYAQMVAVLIEAVKELNTKITNLENENTQLKASLAKSEENKQQIDNLQSQLTGILKLLENSQNDENVTTSED